MRMLTCLAALLGSAATTSALVIRSDDPGTTPEGFIEITPGGIEDLIVSEDTTLNGTYRGPPHVEPPPDVKAMAALPFHFVNNFGGEVYAYITGLDSSSRSVFVRGDGSILYPSSGGSAVPVAIGQDIAIRIAPGQTLDFTVPISISSGRIYFAGGPMFFAVVGTPIGEGIVQPAAENPSDPSAGVSWGFVEFTLRDRGDIFANISYVDFVGMPLGMMLAVNNGPSQTAYGVTRSAVNNICSGLVAQSSRDGRPWSRQCFSGPNGLIRALANVKYHDLDPNGFATYWDGYVNEVWSRYSRETLVIDTQNSERGRVNCRVSGDALNCDGDNRPYYKPTAKDIWGCDSGPFGKLPGDNAVHLDIIPRLCSGFVRTTLLYGGGELQPSLGQTSYYRADPTHHYSRLVHENEVDGKGYAYSYDDVNPNGENASGSVSSDVPQSLTVYIGSPP
jgi:hypothetical protein